MAHGSACKCWCVVLNRDTSPWLSLFLVPDVDFDRAKEARAERKKRTEKNERQRKQNEARAQAPSDAPPQSQRKSEIEKTLATTRISTASMGKFDKRLDGEKKLRGIKRKVWNSLSLGCASH